MDVTASPLWHPCTQMKDHEELPPLNVKSAKGSYLELADGRQVIDVISSWWCKNLGHGHPVLREALIQQAQQLEHCMLASATHDAVQQLSQKLTSLMPDLNKVTYASDGACAVEMAMKMSIHSRQLLGQSQRTKFMSLSGAYHGETCGALSVSDLGLYCEPYRPMMMAVDYIKDIPYVNSRQDPLWEDAQFFWERTKQQLETHANTLTAIVIEPILQAANGMKLYSADYLKRLNDWCMQHGIHLIADEIMTGCGRTGKMLACEHAGITPDFVCLGKSLTGGWLPMSAVLTHDAIYDLFYDDYELGKSFLHSHTYSGNPLAARVALAAFKVIENEHLVSRAASMETLLLNSMQEIADTTGQLRNVRGIGMVVAADLVNPNQRARPGFEIFQRAIKQGLLLRPLGNTIYWVLPLNVTKSTIDDILVKMKQIDWAI
ncbi:MAG: adenosylmethionine--8-amino-7-oxononanoate transaminase [Coxiella sp. (in: Bacteria)]|nr:MAG: adenosylmethionine--8-amino-7-oxononanoate transaminase [Coxiella sp. (in: g-proteobacteria)]